MSTLSLLPLIKVADGVQPGEDWRLSIAFYLDDGVTPINLTELTFSLSVDPIAGLTSEGGQLVASGPLGNVLIITAFAAQTSLWPIALYPMSLMVSDGVYTRDIFVSSTLAVGAGQIARVSALAAPDNTISSVASPVSSALAAAFEALDPSAIASALAALPTADLSPLMQSLASSLLLQSGSSAPVSPGQAFVNSSGYMVIAQ